MQIFDDICTETIETVLKVSCPCAIGELFAYHFVDTLGVESNPKERGGPWFKSSWWGIDSMTCRWRPIGGRWKEALGSQSKYYTNTISFMFKLIS
jgi:hypothetical protein